MAHKKAGGSKAQQGSNVIGKRLGIKIPHGATIKTGQIIARQRGRSILPGKDVGMGRDYTLFAKAPGVVEFVKAKRVGNKKKVNIREAQK
jgi:large subunit ribosomal protein L27